MRTFLVEDGVTAQRRLVAPTRRIALGLVTPEGHHLERDLRGENDEIEHHNGRHAGWEMYFVVNGRGETVDWVALTDITNAVRPDPRTDPRRDPRR